MRNITALKRPPAINVDNLSVLGRVVRSKTRKLRYTYYQIVGVSLFGCFDLRNNHGFVFGVRPDLITIVDDVMFTPVGFVRRGCRVKIDDSGFFEVDHFSSRRNLIYITRFGRYGIPFPVRPEEILFVSDPVKD